MSDMEATNAAPPADHFEQSLAAALKEAEAAEGGDSAGAEQEAPAAKKTTAPAGRDKAGKFVAADAKSEAKDAKADDAGADEAEAGEPGEAESEPAEAAHGGGGLRTARKMVADGDIAGALKMLGLSPEKLSGSHWKAFNHREKLAVQREREAAQKTQQLEGVARQLEQHYGRFEQARKAYEAEDFETAFKLAFSDEPSEFNKKLVQKLQVRDPKVAQLEKELRELRAERQRQDQEAEQRAVQVRRQNAQAQHMEKLSNEMAEMEDAPYARVAHKPAFIKKVFDVQQQHYHRTGKLLPTAEAAAIGWDDLYGDVLGDAVPSRESAAQRSGTVRVGKPGKKPAKAGTTLNHSEAAEAAPDDMTPDEVFDFYVKKATAEARQTRA